MSHLLFPFIPGGCRCHPVPDTLRSCDLLCIVSNPGPDYDRRLPFSHAWGRAWILAAPTLFRI